jgi:hypothetical protein
VLTQSKQKMARHRAGRARAEIYAKYEAPSQDRFKIRNGILGARNYASFRDGIRFSLVQPPSPITPRQEVLSLIIGPYLHSHLRRIMAWSLVVMLSEFPVRSSDFRILQSSNSDHLLNFSLGKHYPSRLSIKPASFHPSSNRFLPQDVQLDDG